MLAKLSKKIFSFDIQKEAIKSTKDILDKENISNVKLISDSHEYIGKYLENYKNKISLVLFNLGYLPGGNKSITTNHNSTLKAIKESLKLLNNKGIILAVCYPHEEGKKESKTILNYLNKNDIKYVIYRNTNNINAPFLIEIKK